MTENHIISRQRVIDHGEVLTPPGLVNDMLNLPGVVHECERIDAKFLEPACGNGNFLAEVLRRRLAVVDRKCRRALICWEQDALQGLACIYGIEWLYDNVNECRDRLHGIFAEAYISRFGKKAREAVLDAARHILRCNILQGDALEMTTVGDKVMPARPLIFTEWSILSGGKVKRWRYEFRELTRPLPGAAPSLFEDDVEPLFCEAGKPVFIARPLDSKPVVHYLKLAESEGIE
jgi:hypothetical protein